MTCGIIGLGHVGQAMHKRFPDAVLFDEPKGIGSREEINQCDVAFVCVPTPSLDDGSCDTTIVEAVLTWVHCSVVIIRSTVPVGFTKRMARKHNLNLVFQPEYYGETVAHPFANLENQSWISLGGENEAVKLATCFYQERVNSNIRFYFSDSDTVELAKYMENAFLATKVTFCNEMYDMATKMGVDYNMAREIWLADPRIGRSHTFVYPAQRGFGGSCLPKDTSALIRMGEDAGADMLLMKSVLEKNKLVKKEGM